MPLQTTMKGFDIVYAITQKALNTQLAVLAGSTIPTKIVIGDPDTFGAELTGTIAAPTMNFTTSISDLHTAYLNIRFTDGIFSYYQGHGSNQVLTTCHVAGWIACFNVKLNIAQIAQDYIKVTKAIPSDILRKLTAFDETMFTIHSIFIDFEDANHCTYDASKSSVGNDAEIGKKLGDLLRVWLLNHKGTNNPFILGYPISKKTALKSNFQRPSLFVPFFGMDFRDDDNYRQAENEETQRAIFEPSGTTFSTTINNIQPDLSTLNFLLVTGDRDLTKEPALMWPDAGAFSKNFIENKESDGKVIIAHETFFNRYLYNLLIKPLETRLQSLPDYVNARPDRSPNVVLNDKTHGFLLNGNGWRYGDHVKLSWHESGDNSHDRESEQNIQFNVNVTTENDSSGNPRLTVNIYGSIYRYEWDQLNTDIKGWAPFVGTFTLKSNVYVGKGWGSAAINFSIKLQFICQEDGTILITQQSSEDAPIKQSGTAGIYEFADFFNQILGFDQISDDWSYNAASLGAIEAGIAYNFLNSISPLLDSTMQKVILPAKNEFSYKNIQINGDSDIEIELKYK